MSNTLRGKTIERIETLRVPITGYSSDRSTVVHRIVFTDGTVVAPRVVELGDEYGVQLLRVRRA